MSKSTVEIPVDWLIRVTEQAKDTIKFHDGVAQQLDPTKAALLLGYISSVSYLLPDATQTNLEERTE